MSSVKELPFHVEGKVLEIVDSVKIKPYRIEVGPGCLKGFNYLGQIARVKVVSLEDKKSAITFIIKISQNNEKLRKNIPINLYYKRELYAYSTMLPNLYKLQERMPMENRFQFAKFYDGIEKDYMETVVLEDLSCKGFVVHSRLKKLDRAHLELIVKTMARFHAMSFVLKQENASLFNELIEHTARNMEYYDELEKALEDRKNYFLSIIDDLDDRAKFAKYLNNMMERLEYFLTPKIGGPYNVICHGDCWPNNFMYLYENGKVKDMRLLDWQLIRLSSPVCDLIYSIYTCSNYEMRSECLDQLLDMYYETLKLNVSLMDHDIAKCFPEAEYRRQVEMFIPFGLVISVMVLPVALCYEDNIPDFEKVMDDNSSFVFVYSEYCKQRFLGLVEEFNKHGFLW